MSKTNERGKTYRDDNVYKKIRFLELLIEKGIKLLFAQVTSDKPVSLNSHFRCGTNEASNKIFYIINILCSTFFVLNLKTYVAYHFGSSVSR